MVCIKELNLQTVWQELRTALKHFIRSRVSNEQDSEDILQEVFIKLHNHLPELKEEEKFQSWVYQITRNTIIDFYRSRGKHQYQTTELDNKQVLQNAAHMIGEGNKNEVISTWLKALMDQLPKNYKEALIYTELDHHTQKELADKLGISLSGAKSRVQRGREKLKGILLECCHLEFDRFGNILDYRVNKGNCSCKEIDEKNN